MRTVVTAPLVHRCPFVDELDVGTVTIEFSGSAPELHDLAQFLASFAGLEISHEDLTERIADRTHGTVTTRFRTAGLDIECTA